MRQTKMRNKETECSDPRSGSRSGRCSGPYSGLHYRVTGPTAQDSAVLAPAAQALARSHARIPARATVRTSFLTPARDPFWGPERGTRLSVKAVSREECGGGLVSAVG